MNDRQLIVLMSLLFVKGWVFGSMWMWYRMDRRIQGHLKYFESFEPFKTWMEKHE